MFFFIVEVFEPDPGGKAAFAQRFFGVKRNLRTAADTNAMFGIGHFLGEGNFGFALFDRLVAIPAKNRNVARSLAANSLVGAVMGF